MHTFVFRMGLWLSDFLDLRKRPNLLEPLSSMPVRISNRCDEETLQSGCMLIGKLSPWAPGWLEIKRCQECFE